jgi:hypothetical protein
MAARDRYTVALQCPTCGTKGSREADVSEDDHPYMRDPGLHVDSMPPEFTHAYGRARFNIPGSYGYSPYHVDQDIICQKCGTRSKMFPNWGKSWGRLP